MKKIFVRDLSSKEGDEVEIELVLLKKEEKQGKKGTRYKEFIFKDKSGTINGIFFEDKETTKFSEGEVYLVKGIVEKFNESLRLRVKEASLLEAFDLKDYVPVSPKDPDILWEELKTKINSVRKKELRALLSKVFSDKEFVEELKRAPAAKKYHHTYMGGLLEHTLSVTDLAVRIASRYKEVELDLLITGAILHDVGKAKEYTIFPEIDRTDEGRLLGHIVLGYERIKREISKIKDFPRDTALKLLHMILSHHGEQRWGSPIEPQTVEAQILHFVDNIDAKIWMFFEAARSKKGVKRWSEFHRGLSRFVFLGEDFEGEYLEEETLF